MNDKTAKITVIATALKKEFDKEGLQFAGIIFDPTVSREDGKLEFHAIQNVPNSRADVLLEASLS